MLKKIVLVLCLTMSFLSFSMEMVSSTNSTEISKANYYTGGVLGVLPGFGIGHAVQGRWMEKGWIFTAGEVVSAAGLVYFALNLFNTLPTAKEIVDNYSENSESSKAISASTITSGALALVFLTLFLSFKAVETVDVWSFSHHHYKVAEGSSYQLRPSYYSYNGGESLGLSLNFKW